MKLKVKIIIAILFPVLFMTAVPFLSIQLAPDLAGMGLWVLCFFAVYPILAIGLGALAGTEVRKLWWIPLFLAAAFPLLFGIAIADFVWDLYVYSAFYLPLGLLAMGAAHFLKKLARKKSE